MRRIISRIVSLFLICSLGVAFCGCTLKVYALELSKPYKSQNSTVRTLTNEEAQALWRFSLELFGASLPKEGGALISPLSVLLALGMLENGAEGNTLEQIEALTGLDRDTLNVVLKSYTKTLSDTGYLKSANSIWFHEGDVSVLPSFLQTNADFYGADAYSAPFDETTLRDINHWVSNNTDKMIEKLLNEIPKDVVMYLINALAFDAEWQTRYTNSMTDKGVFHAIGTDEYDVLMMHGKEDVYISTEQAQGFFKPYKGGAFRFVAILPNENVDFAQYLASFDYAEYAALMESADYGASVNATIPAFTDEYSMSLIDALKSMGMTDAFEDFADFDAIGGENCGLYVSEVLHKTYITLDKDGTRAAAVTSIGMEKTSMTTKTYTVTLDRPFIYMITDSTYGIPLFIGAVTSVK